MKKIGIKTHKPYDVLIGSGLLTECGEYLRSVLKKTVKVALISDSTVWKLYGSLTESSLQKAGFETIHYVFPAGESSKSAETYLGILNFLAENELTRTDALVALGGGVTGDMTGFVAATYLRGIAYIQIPTTLLAMVDSSVGGKTAIDLPAGKNLVGAFYQPKLVLCDLDTLNSLPESIFCDGCAEVIKYSVLYDPELFEYLSVAGLQFNREKVVSRCVEWKRDVVAEDEFDVSARQKLNLGHTIGHAIELRSDFKVTHGQAVAAGIAIIAKAGVATGYSDDDIYRKVKALLKEFKLSSTTEYSAQNLYTSTLADKKRAGNTINLIIPKTIGCCSIVPMPVERMLSFIKEGL